MKFTKKPIEIDAMRFDGTQTGGDEIVKWSGGNKLSLSYFKGAYCLSIQTLEGIMTAGMNDWIIRGVKGEFYPCSPDIFAATYEPTPPSPTP
jgi:hypothetical protein